MTLPQFDGVDSILDTLLMEAEKRSFAYQEFLYKLFKHEVKMRDEKSIERRLKQAAFP
ncbi:ATP-binding protein [Desulfolucanica intricata]|uniref:ATP-binding protein n=1 Tax=Desulfolucanica intricata TaxID=1285191 RepID=UPI000A922817|nr:ATP-binding protein [Desulfolucanica intricata]